MSVQPAGRDWTNVVPASSEEIYRWRDVHRIVKLSENTVRKLEKEGRFPKRFPLTDYSVGWLRSEIEGWMLERRNSARPAAARIA